MTILTRDQIQAFLDDLALISVRHGFYLSSRWMRVLEVDDRFGGYEPSPVETFSGPVQLYVYEAGTQPIGEVYSLDVSKLSAQDMP